MSRFKRVLVAAAVAVVPALAVVAVTASPAAATRTPNPECNVDTKTTVTTLVDRPDNGHHGVWANDNITRTVRFTIKSKKPIASVDVPKLKEATIVGIHPEWLWTYHAEVTDGGTFKAFGGATLSPNAGHGLVAGTHGTVDGGYTADFIAVACWQNFQAAYDNMFSPTGAGYTGSAPSTTPDFVKGDWGGTDFVGRSLNDDWHWTYVSCAEMMVDSAVNAKAGNEFFGDVTGAKTCPSPSPSTSTSAAPSPSNSSGGVIPVGNPSAAVTAGLPVTGSNAAWIAAAGAGMILVGTAGIVVSRRRRAARI